MDLQEIANRFEDGVAALERIADEMEKVTEHLQGLEEIARRAQEQAEADR